MALIKQVILLLTVQIAAEVKNPPPSILWRKFDRVEVTSSAVTLPEALQLPANTPLGPEFMLLRGSGLWSSDPKSALISDNAAVSIQLFLNQPIKLQGLHIEWLIPPSTYRVRGSLGASAMIDLVSWTRTSVDTSTSDVSFPSIQRLSKVYLEMKEDTGQDRISISFVAAITPKISLVMIVSGITVGEEEFCLSRIGSQIYLTSCLTEIARHSGNELWRIDDQNRIYHAIAGTLLAIDSKGSSLILANPDTVAAGAGFSISRENQLIYIKAGENQTASCVSLLGRSVKDVIKSLRKPVTASGGDNPSHLVDGDLDSVWLSSANSRTNKFSVSIIIPLESLADSDRVKEISVLWKYPAESITLSGSDDGIKWQILETVQGNRLLHTLIPLDPNSQTFLNYKLDLTAAHKTLAKLTAHSWAYGIREIDIRFYGLSLTIGSSCDDVYENSEDGRNFFFYKAVEEFSTNVMEGVEAMTATYRSHKSELTASLAKVSDLDFGYCTDRVKSVKNALTDLIASSARLRHYVAEQEESTARTSPILPERCSDIPTVRTQLQHLGASEFLPIFPEPPSSAFLPLQPRCGRKPIRMFCPSGHTLYTSEIESAQPESRLKVYSIEGIKRLCSDQGLEANNSALLTSNDGVTRLKLLIDSTGVCQSPTFIPLAYSQDVLGLRWADISGSTDLTRSVYSLAGLSNPGQGASKDPLFGYNCSAFTFSDWSTTALRAVVCSLEQMAIEPTDLPNLNCVDSVTSILTRQPFSSSIVQASCPNKCFETLTSRRGNDYVNGLVTGSSSHGYSQTSSICLAAHHSGILPSHKDQPILVKVLIGAGLASYAKQTAYGITSLQSSDEAEDYSFKIQSLLPACERPRSESRSKKNGTRLLDDLISAPLQPLHHGGASKKSSNETEWFYEPREQSVNQRLLKILLRTQGQIYENINDYQTSQILELDREVIMEARGWMKPIEKNLKNLNASFESLDYYQNSARLSRVMRSVLLMSENADAILEKFRTDSNRLKAPGKTVKWKDIDDFYGATMQLSIPQATLQSSSTNFGTFELISLVQLGQTSGISLSSAGLDENSDGRVIVFQPNIESSAGIALPAEPCIDYSAQGGILFVGNVLILKNEIKYDGIWSAKFLNPQEPADRSRIGLVAKYKDFNNMLLGFLEQQADGGLAKFVSVVNGREELLGSIPWEWQQLKKWFQLAIVKSQRDRFSLYIQSEQSTMIHLITIQTETWAGKGALGLYTNFATPVMMTELNFAPTRCYLAMQEKVDDEGEQSMPMPSACSLYEESFQKFKEHWTTDASDLGLVDWRVELVKDRLAIVQRNAIPAPGASLVARKPLGCNLGQISFSYLTPCRNYRLSVLVRGIKEIVIHDSTSKPELKDEEEAIDDWRDFRIVLTANEATIYDGEKNSSYSIEIQNSDEQEFGFAVAECGGLAISNIQAQPLDRSDTTAASKSIVNAPGQTQAESASLPIAQKSMIATFLQQPSPPEISDNQPAIHRSVADIFVNREEL